MSFFNNPISSLGQAAQTAGQHLGSFGQQVGDVVVGAGEVAVGHTSIPLYIKNGTTRPIWVAVRAQFHSGSSSFPTGGWETRAWYKIAPGDQVYPGDLYTNVFYYVANDDSNHVWEGDYSFGSFVDAAGFTNDNKKFRLVQLANNWLTFSSYTQTLNL